MFRQHIVINGILRIKFHIFADTVDRYICLGNVTQLFTHLQPFGQGYSHDVNLTLKLKYYHYTLL